MPLFTPVTVKSLSNRSLQLLQVRSNKLLYYAILRDVEIDEANYTTRYTFTDLTPIEGDYPLSSLRLRSSNRPLSDNFIRTYAICHTPAFIQA